MASHDVWLSSLQALERDRYSAAFFVDPDKGVHLKDLGQSNEIVSTMSVAEYITYRSGGGDGVAYLEGET